uniref:Uncharacterized protein n=1 Tax=Noccaea caerulescens TaxID=107243 RepID=A0A1J3CZY1_NOCCA
MGEERKKKQDKDLDDDGGGGGGGGVNKESATKVLDFGPSLLARFSDDFDTFLEQMLQLQSPHLHLILECSHLLLPWKASLSLSLFLFSLSLSVPRRHQRFMY